MSRRTTEIFFTRNIVEAKIEFNLDILIIKDINTMIEVPYSDIFHLGVNEEYVFIRINTGNSCTEIFLTRTSLEDE